jgi:uncharacterized hydrophobic protein (TIGR00271 family)
MDIHHQALPLRQREVQKWFGVWGVADYYTLLKHEAEEGAEYSVGYFLLVVAAAVLAVGGLLLNNPAIIIGAMCVAPFLGPSRAVCIGGIYGDAQLIWRGFLKQVIGLLIIGVALSLIITLTLTAALPDIGITDEILARSMPSPQIAMLSVMVAVAAGAAASLSLSAEPRVVSTPLHQLIDTAIGVEIAISLIPPAAVIGIGLALGRPDISLRSLALLGVNVLGINVVGSMFVLALRGVRKRWLEMEQTACQIIDTTVDTISPGDVEESQASVTLVSACQVRAHVIIRNYAGDPVPDGFAQTLAARITEASGCQAEVLIDEVSCQKFSALAASTGSEVAP